MRQPRYRAAIRAGRINQLPMKQLHQIFGHFRRLYEEQGELSDRQNWLWDRVEAELAYRWHNSAPSARCHCEICFGAANPSCPF